MINILRQLNVALVKRSNSGGLKTWIVLLIHFFNTACIVMLTKKYWHQTFSKTFLSLTMLLKVEFHWFNHKNVSCTRGFITGFPPGLTVQKFSSKHFSWQWKPVTLLMKMIMKHLIYPNIFFQKMLRISQNNRFPLYLGDLVTCTGHW